MAREEHFRDRIIIGVAELTIAMRERGAITAKILGAEWGSRQYHGDRLLIQVCNTDQDPPSAQEWADFDDWRTDIELSFYLPHYKVSGEYPAATRP